MDVRPNYDGREKKLLYFEKKREKKIVKENFSFRKGIHNRNLKQKTLIKETVYFCKRK